MLEQKALRVHILSRRLMVVNTDPQRRYYNGCFYKTETVWSAWAVHETVTPENAEERIKFWRELNDYAVSQRGEADTRMEFKFDSSIGENA